MDLNFVSNRPISYLQCTFYCAVDLFSVIQVLPVYQFIFSLLGTFDLGSIHTKQEKFENVA